MITCTYLSCGCCNQLNYSAPRPWRTVNFSFPPLQGAPVLFCFVVWQKCLIPPKKHLHLIPLWTEWDYTSCVIKIAAAYSRDTVHELNNTSQRSLCGAWREEQWSQISREPRGPPPGRVSNMLHRSNTLRSKQTRALSAVAELGANYLGHPADNQCFWKMSQHFQSLK